MCSTHDIITGQSNVGVSLVYQAGRFKELVTVITGQSNVGVSLVYQAGRFKELVKNTVKSASCFWVYIIYCFRDYFFINKLKMKYIVRVG